MDDIVVLACFTGFISAVSLGSVIGLATRPGARVTSALMAFGGGALLFALTIEIVAHSCEAAGFFPLALGCVIGGILYEFLNHGLNSMGAFLPRCISSLFRIRVPIHLLPPRPAPRTGFPGEAGTLIGD